MCEQTFAPTIYKTGSKILTIRRSLYWGVENGLGMALSVLITWNNKYIGPGMEAEFHSLWPYWRGSAVPAFPLSFAACSR